MRPDVLWASAAVVSDAPCVAAGVGVDVDGIDPPDLPANVPAAERANSYKEFQADPYGCRDPSLRRGPGSRNPQAK